MCHQRRPKQLPNLAKETHEQLMVRLQKGQTEALNVLAKRWHHRLVGLAYSILRDHEDARDCAEDVWHIVLDKPHRYDASRPFGPWILTVCTNHALNLLRSEGVWFTVPLEDGDTPALTSKQPDEPLHDLIKREGVEKVREALDSLPDKYRVVLVLKYFEDMSVEDIAKLVGITILATQSLLYRAREKLRKKLQDLLG